MTKVASITAPAPRETEARAAPALPARLEALRQPQRTRAGESARAADLRLIALAPEGYLDTTHFDTVRFPPPEWALPAFSAAASDGAMAYSGYRGHTEVLREVAANLSAFLGAPIDPARNVILTPGTQGGLFVALAALVAPGQRVAIGCPEYLFSDRILRFLGATVAPVPLLDGGSTPGPDLDVLEHEFRERGTRVFVFSNPNNPTGAVHPRATLEAIAALAAKYDAFVVVDELYARLIHEGPALCHLRSLPGMAERTLSLLGPSKTESLSGYRLGVVVGPEPLVARMEDMQSILSLRAGAYAQAILPHWLRDDKAWLAGRLRAFTALRAMTEARLTRLDWVRWRVGRGTAYAWVDVRALDLPGDRVAEALLTQAGVLVSPGYQFGDGCDGFFRVCYARDEAGWSAALDRITDTLDGLARKHGVGR